MTMLKQLLSICLILLCIISCCEQHAEKKFLTQYEFEDYSLFSDVHIFIRGTDRYYNPIVFVSAPQLFDDSKYGCYVVVLDKNNQQVIRAGWMGEGPIEADTLTLKKMAQCFLDYRIPRLDVDKQGNVFVYLRDVETLALVRFTDGSEIEKQNNKCDEKGIHYWERKWKKVRGNRYRYESK